MTDPLPAAARVRAALRANLLPGIGLWTVALAVVLAFYLVPACRPAFTAISGWKADGGFLFSAVANALAGGLLPWVIARLLGRRTGGGDLVFLMGLCAYRAVEVDALYRMQAVWFGDGHDAGTVALKVAVDQLLYSALWSSTTSIVLLAWKDAGYGLAGLRTALSWRTVGGSWWPLVAANWLVWTPTCTLVYCLPGDLQIPLFCLASAFWMLVLVVILAPRPASA
jgi:hypothetical protein